MQVTVYALGQQLSAGEGEIRKDKVRFKFDLMGSPTVVQATLTPDGLMMKGTYTMELTNDPQSMVLKRIN